MERIFNDDEKIRKAEEIYYRRNNQNINIGNKSIKKTSNAIKNKLLLQLLFMINIAIIIFCVQNKDFIFTKDFLGVVNQYNINISENIKNIFRNLISEEEITEEEKNIEVIEEKNENPAEELKEEITSSISEMDLDIENLKGAYSFIKPIDGTVSSEFGSRESQYQKVTGYHTGIDLASPKRYTNKSFNGRNC